MENFAALIAASINSGTPLLIAALGLLINERAGVLNLGAEGMMLVAAVAGFARLFFRKMLWLPYHGLEQMSTAPSPTTSAAASTMCWSTNIRTPTGCSRRSCWP